MLFWHFFCSGSNPGGDRYCHAECPEGHLSVTPAQESNRDLPPALIGMNSDADLIPLLKSKMAIYSIVKCSVRYFSAVIISELCSDCKIQEIWDSTCVISVVY